MKKLKMQAMEKKAYSNMYNEAKELMDGEDEEEFEMFFDAIKSQFLDLEKRYKYAVQHKKRDVKLIGMEFEKMMITYKAAMNVKFDLEETKKEKEAEMEAEVPEKEELEIKTTVEYMVKKKDTPQLKYLMKHAYDLMSKAEIAYENEPDNQKLSEKFA